MSMKGAKADAAWFLVLVSVRMAAMNERRRCYEEGFVGDFWQRYTLLSISAK